ncbi:MAG: class I SAM-dependent methyltransferase [Treponema sp.]|jgi:SAM-dependent methyltransferase|nr:class I SAM-dependent methyltransferase [Treponema sp.]
MADIADFVGTNILLVTNLITLICLLFLIFYYRIPKEILLRIGEPKYSKSKFLKIIDHNGKLLDVGCGNNSPYNIKTKYPNIAYTGIDVGDYNQTQPNLADNYIVVKPEEFAEAIANLPELFDTVISSHNLEHCNDRKKTLDSMIKVLKPEGYLFLSFPTEESVNFPGPRRGTLNYYDDPTHQETPPEYEKIISTLKENNMQILFSNKSCKPFLWHLIGYFMEWKSKKNKVVIWPFTWSYWGFETIIWAMKK